MRLSRKRKTSDEGEMANDARKQLKFPPADNLALTKAYVIEMIALRLGMNIPCDTSIVAAIPLEKSV